MNRRAAILLGDANETFRFAPPRARTSAREDGRRATLAVVVICTYLSAFLPCWNAFSWRMLFPFSAVNFLDRRFSTFFTGASHHDIFQGVGVRTEKSFILPFLYQRPSLDILRNSRWQGWVLLQ